MHKNDYKQMEERMSSLGYKEALSQFKETYIQQGFNHSFHEAYMLPIFLSLVIPSAEKFLSLKNKDFQELREIVVRILEGGSEEELRFVDQDALKKNRHLVEALICSTSTEAEREG
eukprot:CAMPEP_0117445170 /NCGR_PEP_ID=MMETSP0759-20121206/5649_1 /TAXON_ID=63605 /ORGANISM="Percolomonas cosmopolitus, Strain WS" /LENGTH=115 /DNA_ID=CAMNT_0005237321 /DNA_START=68 /DNA_END=415 /DNA_ORIENTATION=-